MPTLRAQSMQPKFRPVRLGKVVDRKRWTSSSKLFQLDRMDPLSFGPKFPEISVEWIVPYNLGNGLICFYVGVGVGRRRFCKRVSLEYTVEPCCNEPRYNKVLGIMNNVPYPSNSEIYGKEPRYNETSV